MVLCVYFSMAGGSRAVYHLKLPGLHWFTVSTTRRQYNVTVNASLSINVLDRVSGLRLTAQRPHSVLYGDIAGSLFTDPISFTARYLSACYLLFVLFFIFVLFIYVMYFL